MIADKADPLDADDGLGAALAACIEAIDRGDSDPRSILARYPEYAAELRDFFVAQERAERVAGPLRPVVQAAQTPTVTNGRRTALLTFDLPRHFGDFELLTELGRGGMGVVFQARQLSLNRLVALKLFGTDPLASAVELLRFRNEAEIAARLDHPRIVPIYDVGEHDGRLYFSMKLLEGGSLAQSRVRGRGPGVCKEGQRDAARIVADVARAVHHAHERGVLHRDLKPANILLDAAGNPYVSDFGLARRIESDSGLTQSGVIVGTPGYMAPEQASGQRIAVTTATDVYGLGAILYAALTGRPPFRGDSVLDTLQQVRQCEPDSPSSINRLLNRDLETICLKCLEKEPARRYRSAEAVTLDLECWLRGEPITARSASRWHRLSRWCRRNPVVAGLLALVVLGSAASTGWIAWQMAQTKAESLRAKQNLDMAYQLLDELYLDQVGNRISSQQELSAGDRKLLERLLGFYLQFAAGNSHQPATRLQMAQAYRRVSDIQFALGEYASADRANERSVRVLEKLVTDFPSDGDYWKKMVSGRVNWGHALLLCGRLREAEQAYGLVASLCEERLKSWPAERAYKSGMATGNLNRFNALFLLGRGQEAEQAGRTAIRLYEELTVAFPDVEAFLQSLLTSRDNLTELLLDGYRLDEAEETYKEMERLMESRKGAFPNVGNDRIKHAHIQAASGFILRARGRLSESKEHYEKALALMIPWAAKSPNSPDVAPVIADARLQLGIVLRAERKLSEAESSLGQALEPAERIVKRCPGVPCYTAQLAQIRLHLGELLQATGRVNEAEASYAKAQELLEKVTAGFPDRATDRSNLGAVLDRQAELLWKRGERKRARQLLERAGEHHEAAYSLNPTHPVYRQLRNDHRRLVTIAQKPALSGKEEPPKKE